LILNIIERRTQPEAAGRDWFRRVLRPEVLDELAGPLGRADWAVEVVLIDDGAMAGLNEGFRKVPGVTDVLSFSYLQEDGAGEPDLSRSQGYAYANLWLDTVGPDPENEVVSVGEVVLAPRFVAERCREKGWPLEHELPLLVVHGILHVLGWDHMTDQDREKMQAVEEDILAAHGLPHPLRGRS
jgi:probable rRNA maturation factor